MTIIIRGESGMEKEHHVPRDRHLNVHTSDFAEAGDTLTDGPLVPHDILRIKGEEALQRYLTSEIQNVYRSQNVNINDKHIEIICAQMMRKVEIESVGDSSFLPGEIVDKFVFREENEILTNSIKITSVGDASDLQIGQVIDKIIQICYNKFITPIGKYSCLTYQRIRVGAAVNSYRGEGDEENVYHSGYVRSVGRAVEWVRDG